MQRQKNLPDRINFIVSGSVYNVSVELIEQLLAGEGMYLFRATPLQVIDKVGFLKTGDDAKDIVADLLAKYMLGVGFTVTEVDQSVSQSPVTSGAWPFPVSGTDSQSVLDLDVGSACLPGGELIGYPVGQQWAIGVPMKRKWGMPFKIVDLTHLFDYLDDESEYSLAMNADRE